MFGYKRRKENGTLIITGEFGAPQELATKQCCHCGKHWVTKPGSGAIRGFCPKCDDHVCGDINCVTRCYPYEKQLEDYEKGKLLVL